MSGRQVLVDAEALAKVLMLLPHDAISHLPDEAGAAQSLRNALTQPQPSSSDALTLLSNFIQAPRASKEHAEFEREILALDAAHLRTLAANQMVLNGLMHRIQAAEYERRWCELGEVGEAEATLEEAENDLRAWLCDGLPSSAEGEG